MKFDFQDPVAETLLITLYMKSLISKQDNPILVDETACRLVEQIDYDFNKFDSANMSLIGVSVRAKYFDETVIDFIKTQDNPIVVSLGCGLDDRYGRVSKQIEAQAKDKAIFYEVDLPEVIDIRKKLIPNESNQHTIASSILDQGWMKELRLAHPDAEFIFVIEGVLMYFTARQARHFFKDMANQFLGTNSEMIFDVASTFSTMLSGKHDSVRYCKARFEYGCDDNFEMSRWADNLEFINVKSIFDFPEWSRLNFFAKMMIKLPLLTHSSRILRYRLR